MAVAQSPPHTDDVTDWTNRISAALAKPETITGPAPAGARSWRSDFFGCFDPIETCVVTWFCPCVTFGKTHHRLRKDPTMKGWTPVNPTCLGWWASACCGLHVIPNLLQRREIRDKYHLEGDFVTDCLRAWCCNCCDLIQQEKESEYHVLENTEMVINQQPGKVNGMQYNA